MCDIHPEFFNQDTVKSRKVHRCCECSAPIEIGEIYIRSTGKWDGKVDTIKQHSLCASASTMWSKRHDDDYNECHEFGSLRSYNTSFLKKNNEDEVEIRKAMAKILWRQRKFRRFKNKWMNNILMEKKWGEPWKPCK